MMFSRQLLSFYESKIYIPVPKSEVFSKLWTLFVKKRSMHLGFSGFLKQVFSTINFFESYFNKNSDRLDSVCYLSSGQI